MKKAITLGVILVFAFSLFVVYVNTAKEKNSSAGIVINGEVLNVDKIMITHENISNDTRLETTTTDPLKIATLINLFNSLELDSNTGGQPLADERFVIGFFKSNDEIATWWVDENLITASTVFVQGNYAIENADFVFSDLAPPSKLYNDGSTENDLGDYRPMIYVQDNLYGETANVVISLPNNAISIGTVENVVPNNEPMVQENFTANVMPIGSEMYVDEADNSKIYVELSNGEYSIYELLDQSQ